jgi:hypothetical protein
MSQGMEQFLGSTFNKADADRFGEEGRHEWFASLESLESPHDILFGWAFCHVLPRACSLSGQSSFGCSLIVEKCLSQKDTFLEATSTFHQTSCSLSVRLWRTLRGAVEGQMRGESFS